MRCLSLLQSFFQFLQTTPAYCVPNLRRFLPKSPSLLHTDCQHRCLGGGAHVYRAYASHSVAAACALADLETSSTSAGIIKTVIDRCRNLGIAWVVEGTENAVQLAILTQLGVHLFQGYYFSKPLPLDEIKAYLASFEHDAGAGLSAARIS